MCGMNIQDIDFNSNFMDIIYGKEPPHNEDNSAGFMEYGQDAYGLPFEPIDFYSTEPLEFVETARMLEAEANEAFKLVRLLNRHSPMFLKISAHFGKMLKQLGSICITKAVIEQREENIFEFDYYLWNITIRNLREMAAVNFRKCFDSFMESQEEQRNNQEAFSLSIRWAALDKRLRATEEKIEKIKAGKIKVELPDREEELSELQKAEKSADHAESEPSGSLMESGRALSIDKGALREWEKAYAPQGEPEESYREAKAAGREELLIEDELSPAPAPEEISQEHLPEPDTAEDFPPKPVNEEPDEEPDPFDGYDSGEDDLSFFDEDEERTTRLERMSDEEFLEWIFPHYEYARPDG